MKKPILQAYKMGQMRIVTLALTLCISLMAWCQDINYSTAKSIAVDFLRSRGINTESVVPQRVKKQAPSVENTNSPFYIFNDDKASAFVIVSGSSQTQQILAYSTENSFNEENISPGAAFMLEQYEEFVKCRVQNAGYRVQSAGKLIKTANWSQSDGFWWSECPIIPNTTINTHAGCVATAMAILARYYEWPARGMGQKTYTTDSFGFHVGANFGETDYNISTLPLENQDDYNWSKEQQKAVATLLYHCGVAANMDYGPSPKGSSANYINAIVGMYRHFGYTLGTRISKDKTSDEDWYRIITTEIDNDHPVLYSGHSFTSGFHAFICDGYDSDYRLHFNFGWGGSNNGYYSIVDPNLDYTNYHEIVFGVYPDPDAAPEKLHDLQMMYDPDIENAGITIDSEDQFIRRGSSFQVVAYNVCNVSDSYLKFKAAVFLCDKDGNRKLMLGKKDGLTLQDNRYRFPKLTIPCGIPYDFQPEQGDCIRLFSTTDNEQTWREVGCYNKQLEQIFIDDIYDSIPVHLKMQAVVETQKGLKVKNGDNINAEGKIFNVMAYRLENLLSIAFDGETAIFLCDSLGNMKQEVGKQKFYASYNSFYTIIFIPCSIPSGTRLEDGDYLGLFSCMKQDDDLWIPVLCDDLESSFLPIPADVIAADIILPTADMNGGRNSAIYNIQGIRISQPAKGLYIKNGKKVMGNRE